MYLHPVLIFIYESMNTYFTFSLKTSSITAPHSSKMSSTTGLGSSVAPSFDSETLEHCSNDDDVDINQKVPKSASSSSGVNEISDSSNNSTDEYNKRMEEVTEKEKAGYIPTFRDVMDLLKFSYILQVSIYFQKIQVHCIADI